MTESIYVYRYSVTKKSRIQSFSKFFVLRPESTESLLKAFRETKNFIVEDARRTPKAIVWLVDVLRLLSLIQIAVESRMGVDVYRIENEHDRLMESLLESSQKTTRDQ